MADLDHTQADETQRTERDELALEASWQIEALSDMVLTTLSNMDATGVSGIKSTIIRIRELSSATMSALVDDVSHINDIHRVVHGTPVAAEVHHG